jgi:ACS family D-galactonate transporter-like MFS transporter
MSPMEVLLPKMNQRRLKVAIAISVAFFVAYFDRTNVTVLIADNQFTHDLGIGDSKLQQGLLLTGFLFPYGLCNFFVGPITDKLGGRRGIAIAIIFWTVLMCAMGCVSSFAALLVLRILLGFGESIMTPACNLLVAEWFPDRERARANSAWLAGLFLAPAISFPIIVALVNVAGWRASFWVLASVGLFVALPMVLFWTSNRPEDHAKIGARELAYIRAGQSRTEEPVFSRANAREMFTNYRFWICTFAYMGYGLGFWGISTFVPSYLEHDRGLTFSTSGIVSVAPWLAAAVLTVTGGMLGDRRPRRRVWLWSGGYLLSAVLAYLGISAGAISASVAFIAVSVGLLAFTLPPMWSVVQEIVPRGMTGLGTGIVNGFSYCAAAFGPALVGAIVDHSGSYDLGFLLLAGSLVVTALSLVPLWRGHLPSSQDVALPNFSTVPAVSGNEPPTTSKES